MDIEGLKSICNAKLTGALGYQGGTLSQERLQAMQYYKGEPFGDEEAGKSKVVARVVQEVVDGALPPLLKPFTASQKIADFEPDYCEPRPGESPDQADQRAEDEAKMATHLVNYDFWKRNDGFLILHNWCKDGLLEKLGIVKTWWDDKIDVRTEHYEGLDDLAFSILKEDKQVEIVDDEATLDPDAPLPQPMPPMQFGMPPMPPPPRPMLHKVECKRTRNIAFPRIANVPPDEFLIDHRAVSIDEAPFLCHRVKRSISELKEMFPDVDEDIIDKLPGNDATGDFNIERIERFKDEDAYPYRYDTPSDPTTREVWVNEIYIQVDFDDDGVSELRQVFLCGDANSVILSNEEVDDHPFLPFTPIPMPHKTFGMSMADQTMDLQLIKSTLLRGALNSMYLANEPMVIAEDDGAVNFDDLMNRRAGGIVRVKRDARIEPLPSINVAPDCAEMITYLDSVQESRTGVRKFSSTLQDDTINPFGATATGAKLMDDASNDRLELIAKVWAETGIKRLAKKLLELRCKHQQKAEMLRINGKFVEIDPRMWSREMGVTVNVGLGAGRNEEKLQKLMALAPVLQQLVPTGMIQPQNAYNFVVDLIEAAEIKMPERLITNPTQLPNHGMPQQPPDPQAQQAQAKIQIQQQQSQADLEEQQARTQADIQIANVKASNDMDLAKAKAAMEMQLRERDAQHAAAMEEMKAQHKQALDMAEINARAHAGAYTAGPGGSDGAGGGKEQKPAVHIHMPSKGNKSMQVVRDEAGKIVGANLIHDEGDAQ